MKGRIILYLVLSLGLVSCIKTHTKHYIGIVVDAYGFPVHGASVFISSTKGFANLSPSNEEICGSAVTDRNGTFTFLAKLRKHDVIKRLTVTMDGRSLTIETFPQEERNELRLVFH